MPVQTIPGFVPLPRSHYFLTISRGNGMRTFGIPSVLAHLLVCMLPVLGIIGTGATGYVLFHDEVVASLMTRQSQMQYAYEDRLDALRGELERQSAKQSVDRSALDKTVRDLVSRASKLESRADLVASLAGFEKTAQAPAGAASRPDGMISGRLRDAQNPLAVLQPSIGAPPPLLSYAASSLAPSAAMTAMKPHPEADPAAPAGSPAAPGRVSAITPDDTPLPATLSLAAASLDTIEDGQIGALLRIGSAARQETSRLQATLDDVGLSANRFGHESHDDQGGPFVPLSGGRESRFDDALASLQGTLTTVAHLRIAVARVPLADPLPGLPEVTSPFGARLDPFIGRPALHTGVDLKEAYGTDVKASAAGRVVAAGAAGGYGNMVEIDHGDGITTRYAHLEEVLVAAGQTVGRDSIVGRVGSTGRATGPHLHYEIRIDNEPVDPLRFVNAGLRLVALQTH